MPDAIAAREQLLADLRSAGISDETMALWIEPGEAVGITDDRLELAFPPRIWNCQWVQRRYASLLGDLARRQGLAGVRILCQGPA